MTSRVFGLFLVFACLASAQQGKNDTYRGGLVTPPLPKPRFVLVDTSGAQFDFWNRTMGSVTLLFFGYTNCPDECPMHMANIGSALKKLPPTLPIGSSSFLLPRIPHGTLRYNCADGSTISINTLSA